MKNRNYNKSLLLLTFLSFVFTTLRAQVADFEVDKVEGCAPIRIVFTNKSTGVNSNTKYLWDLGNGVTSPNMDASTLYFNAGTYTITLKVINGKDTVVATKRDLLKIYSKPEVDFVANKTTLCMPDVVVFTNNTTNQSAGAITYSWDFGDGVLSTTKSPTHIYNKAGVFGITLIATTANGCTNSKTINNYITVFDSIRAYPSVNVSESCTLPFTATFKGDTYGADITEYLWNFGNGVTSTEKNPTYTYTTAGAFTPTLQIKNKNGCVDTKALSKTINVASFKADFNVADAVVCQDKSVIFNNTSTPSNLLSRVLWDFGNGRQSVTINPSTAFLTPGTFDVTLTSYFGACEATVTKQITVIPKSTPSFSTDRGGACKAPVQVNFKNETTSGTVVLWDFGNGQTSTLDNPTVTYTQEGRYSVKLIVRNSNGCTDTLVKSGAIVVGNPEIAEISGLPFSGCSPVDFNFTPRIISGEPITKYEWSLSTGDVSSGATWPYKISQPGDYEVKLIVTSETGCTDTLASLIRLGQKPKINFSVDKDNVCAETPIRFTDLSDIGDQWFWDFGDGGTSTAQNPNYRYVDTGFFDVKLIVWNNGCMDSITKERFVYIKPPVALFKDSVDCTDPFNYYFIDVSVGRPTVRKWYIDDVEISSDSIINYKFPAEGKYGLRLYVEQDECKDEIKRDINITNESIDFTAAFKGNCDTSFATFTVTGSTNALSKYKKFVWYIDQKKSDTITGTTYLDTLTTFGNKTIELHAIQSGGCVTIISKSVNIIKFGPIADFTTQDKQVCAGVPIEFKDITVVQNNQNVVKWTWNIEGRDITSTSQSLQYTFTNPGNKLIRLTVEDVLGCKNTITRSSFIKIYKPVANFETTDTLICIGARSIMKNLSTGEKMKFEWTTSNGLTSSDTNAAFIFPQSGYYDIRLKITDEIGCTSEMSRLKYIAVMNAKAQFDVSDKFSTCPPLQVNFTNKAEGGVIFEWDFANGNTSSLKNPFHTFTEAGIFKTRLVVIGNGGCTDTAYQEIVIQGPSGYLEYDPASVCPPVTLQLKAVAKNTSSYTWDFSDGTSNVTVVPTSTHTYDYPGKYVPKIILSDDLGCQIAISGKDTIRVLGAKTQIRQLEKSIFCDRGIVQFRDSTVSDDEITSRRWDFGDGTFVLNELNPVHEYQQPGIYYPKLTVRTKSNCEVLNTLPQPILVSESPNIEIVQVPPLCLPVNNLQLRLNHLNPDTTQVTFNWNFGSLASPSGNRVPPTFNIPTFNNYSIWASVIDNYGCVDTSRTQIIVNDTPHLVLPPDLMICNSSSYEIKAAGADRYQWRPAPGLNCNNCETVIVTPSQKTVYKVTGYNNAGCLSSDSIEVDLKYKGFLTPITGDTICVGEYVQFSTSGTEKYEWTPNLFMNNNTAANPRVQPKETTVYKVVGSDSMNCFRDSLYATVKVYPYPTVNIIDSLIELPTGTPIILKTDYSPDVIRWRWSPSFGLSCTTCPEPATTITRSVIYSLVVENQGGCQARDFVEIKPICNANNLFVPNTFSPNGDGQNDYFYPNGRGVTSIKNMKVFSRWGEVVFERSNFSMNNPGQGWDGTYKGKLMSPDVFVYLIEVICDNNVIVTLKGNVTLIQ
ncbi:PKD domain-containing protein [Polluticaenibacter yanchengensis]|uniref:PKD domain-containing protein n=1 Tax=Polluticaenibacter yanchengensis TaxID=3014562 RepID=A0ABT4ULW5_9BACT|nr:PKD domain-containing protein [Chitinophagaceae bacterium LY-5]